MSAAFPRAKLGDESVAEVILGQSPPSADYNKTGRGLPFFQGKADFGLLHPAPRIWCDSGQKFATADDVLVSVRAPVGDVNITASDCVIGRGLAAVRAGTKTDPWFLYFALMHCKPVLESRATGSTFASVNKTTLVELDIPHPDREDQRAIASLLRFLVQKQAIERDLITVAETLKRAAMHTLFTRGLRGEAQKETEIGPLPESWELVPLGTLGRVGNGSTPKKSMREYWNDGDFPWLTSAKVYDRDIVAADQFVTPTALRECHLPIIEPGAILIAITGQGKTLGHCAVLRMQATVNQHIAYIAIDLERADPSYVRGYLETQYDYFRQVGAGGGSTKGALTCAFLRGVPIPFPSTLDDQHEIVAILDAIDRKIDLHRRKRAVLDELFKALLHKLMTGEIRIAELDLSALACPARTT